MTIHNLYYYHCITNIFKILKYRCPMAMYNHFKLSGRKDTLLITPIPSRNFVYKSGAAWNLSRQILGITDLSQSISYLKTSLKKLIIHHQAHGSIEEWETDCNFITSYIEHGTVPQI